MLPKETLHFLESNSPEPHLGRARALLAQHPEARSLMGNTPSTALHIIGLVAAQIAFAAIARTMPGWAILLLAYVVGAVINHALFVMIHECTHNLVFKGSRANRWIGMLANLPIVFPSAMGFRTFHLLHHRYQGEFDRDADLAGPNEARWVGRSGARKAIWMLFFFVIEGIIRPARLKSVKVLDGWTAINVLVELTFLALTFVLAGPWALAYLALSTMFSIGLHPVGARWIQEHYVVREGQETYSYYGPFNSVMYNVGFHNEHHDLMMVPWSRLPRLKKMAPEFYDTLYAHRSYWKLLLRFLFDPNLNLFSRVTRKPASRRSVVPAGAAAALET